MTMNRVLITGAAGGIGRHLRRLLAGAYPVLRLSDVADVGPAGRGEEVDRTELADATAAERMCAGVDGIVHLGAISVEDDWPAILEANIAGTYNLFEAARRQGVRRIVFATSNHAVGFYRRDRTIDHQVPVRPDSRYGLSKAFGEALGSLYADKHGLEVFNIRIGNVNESPIDRRRLAIWISPRDLAQLVRIGLEHPDVRCETVYGISANDRAWYDNANATRLGYRPEDNSETYVDEVMKADPPPASDEIAERYQGGAFCSDGYDAASPRE